MKKGIKANLYLPKECYKIIEDKFEQIKDYLESNFVIDYDFYIGIYEEKEVCAIEVKLLGKTCREVNADYKMFKEYVKEITHKQVKQVLMFKFDRI